MFQGTVGAQYTRHDVQQILNVPLDKRGGNWATGYTEWDGQFFIFSNIDVAGRTGHDYNNRWNGSELVWQAKNGSTVYQPQVRKLLSGLWPTHIFYRQRDRMPFTYAGLARPVRHEDTSPVTVHWSFETPKNIQSPTEILREELTERGFLLAKSGSKTQKAALGKLVVYIKIDSNSCPLVVGPEWVDWLTDFKLAGANRSREGIYYYHNSTMRAYPKKVHTGTEAIPFGLDFGFASREALQRFLDVLLDAPRLTMEQPEQGYADQADVDPRTETETMRAARLKQSKFRSDLLARHKWCQLTQIEMPELLRASHIKPWSKSSPKERIDIENGLLLAVHLDGLFDKGLISFAEDGKILISEAVTQSTRTALNLDPEWGIELTGDRQFEYMRYHRTQVFADRSKVAGF